MDWNSLHKTVTEYCKKNIEIVGKGNYNPDIYESMGRERYMTDMLNGEKSGICFIGPAGSGKTTLFCRLAEIWSKENLVYLDGVYSHYPEETSLFYSIANSFKNNFGIDLINGMDQFIEELNAVKRKCVILLDGIDECINLFNLKDALHYAIVHLARGPVKLVLNCRASIWQSLVNHTWLKTLQMYTWQPDDEKALFRDPHFNVVLHTFFSKYLISGNVNTKIRELCRFPGFIKLFCEAHRGKPVTENDSIRYIDIYMRYVSNIVTVLAKAFPAIPPKTIVTVIESCVLTFWQSGSYCINKVKIDNVVGGILGNDAPKFIVAMQHVNLIKQITTGNDSYCLFGHQLVLEYLIANTIVKQKLWLNQPRETVMSDIIIIIKDFSENQFLLPVLEFILPILEMMGKHRVLIAILMRKEVDKCYKIMLCRAVTKMGQVDIEAWQMLRELEKHEDADVRAEVASTVCLLGENIPGDQVFHSLRLIQSTDDAAIQRMVGARIKYDPNFSMFIKQIQPYCTITDVQNDVIEFVKRLRNGAASTYRMPILNLTDLITSFNEDAGVENLVAFADSAKEDSAFLDAWSNVVCNHADKIFVKIMKVYIAVVKTDRLMWDRIFKLCINGGQRDMTTALKLMAQGFDSLNNYGLMASTIVFLGNNNDVETDTINSIFSQALKKSKYLPAAKQMELREKIADTAIRCFKKNNRAFAKIIQELAGGDDTKIREKISAELMQLRKNL
jgi:hypothetical protein